MRVPRAPAIVVVVASTLVLAGCGVSRERYQRQLEQTERYQTLHEQERTRAQGLERELQEAIAATQLLLSDREALTARISGLEASLAEAEAAKKELMEVNAALAGQRAKLSQLSEQLSTTWYDAALDRARRAVEDDGATSPVELPVEPAADGATP